MARIANLSSDDWDDYYSGNPFDSQEAKQNIGNDFESPADTDAGYFGNENQDTSDLEGMFYYEAADDRLSLEASKNEELSRRPMYQALRDSLQLVAAQYAISTKFLETYKDNISKRFEIYSKMIKLGEGDRKFARIAAECDLYFLGWGIIHRKFGQFLNANTKDDFEQEFLLAITDALPKYNPKKGNPSPFFGTKIFDAIYVYIATNIKKVSERDARRLSLVSRIVSKCKQHGFDPEEGDIAMEFSIRNITDSANADHIKFYLFKVGIGDSEVYIEEKEDFDNLIAGDPYMNKDFMDPAAQTIQKVSLEDYGEILKGISQDPRDLLCFIRHGINNDAGDSSFEDIAEDIYCGEIDARTARRRYTDFCLALKNNKKFLGYLNGSRVATEFYKKKEDYITNTDDQLELINNAFSLMTDTEDFSQDF